MRKYNFSERNAVRGVRAVSAHGAHAAFTQLPRQIHSFEVKFKQNK